MSKASPPRTYHGSSSTEGGSSPGRRSMTLPRSRSSTLKRKKDLSQDEGSALNDMHRKVSLEFVALRISARIYFRCGGIGGGVLQPPPSD